MAKVTITISDNKKLEGACNISINFEPPIETKEQELTSAQSLGVDVFAFIQEQCTSNGALIADHSGKFDA